jgi:hypothetical protein
MTTNPTITDNGKKLIEWLDFQMLDGKFTNDDLVQFIEVVGKYLGMETISNYANSHKMSYNGVKDHREIREILGVKFVIDNE